MNIKKTASLTLGLAAALTLAACQSNPNYGYYPQQPYPQPGYGQYQQPGYQQQAYSQFGRVAGVDLIRRGSSGSDGTVGAVAGGVVGGALGHQIGGGRGRTAATVAGAVGGALIGRVLEQNLSGGGYDRDVYRVTGHLENGGSRTFDYAEPPNVRVGDRVRVEGNQLYR